MIMYSYFKTIKKGIKYTLLFLAGAMVVGFPIIYADIAEITVGSLVIMFYDWLKHKWNWELL